MNLEIGKVKHSKGKVEVPILYDGRTFSIWYKFPEEFDLHPHIANGIAALCLIPAMKSGTDLVIKDDVISKKLLAGLNTAQDILTKWYPTDLHRINIIAKKTSDKRFNGQRDMVLSCFTGGVDSFHTLLKNKDKITHLLYVHGYDIPLQETEFRKKVSSHLHKVAKKVNKELIEVETNAREFTDYVGATYWGPYFYGPAIASVGLMLAGDVRDFLVPSCQSYADLSPRASHVLLDYLWSTEDFNVIYDGAEASRTEKVAYIAHNNIVKDHLRVCWQSNDDYNCSKCEKCLRTMVSLELFDELQTAKTFETALDYQRVASTPLDNDATFAMAMDSLSIAEEKNKPELVAALRTQTNNYKSAKMFKEFNENFDFFVGSHDFDMIKDRLKRYLWLSDTKSMLKTGARVSKRKAVAKLIVTSKKH